MAQIIPIKDLKDTSAISIKCNNSDEPIFITKNGYGDMVIMSMKVYEQQLETIRVLKSLLAAEDDIKKGNTLDAFEAVAESRKKYGV